MHGLMKYRIELYVKHLDKFKLNESPRSHNASRVIMNNSKHPVTTKAGNFTRVLPHLAVLS